MPVASFAGARPKRIGFIGRYEVTHLVEKLAIERHGKDKKSVWKYNDLASRMIKGDLLRFNLDVIHQQDQVFASHIFTDLNIFTEIRMWTDKITDVQYEKYKRNVLKSEKENYSQ